MVQKRKKVHLTNFNIAGFSYWDGPEAWEKLRIQKLDPTAHTEDQVEVIVYVKAA